MTASFTRIPAFIDHYLDLDGIGTGQVQWIDLINKIDQECSEAEVPDTTSNLVYLLSQFNRVETKVGRLPSLLGNAITNQVWEAIEHCLAWLDYGYLRQKRDLVSLFTVYFPEYERNTAFRRCGISRVLIEQNVIRATFYSLNDILRTKHISSLHIQNLEEIRFLSEQHFFVTLYEISRAYFGYGSPFAEKLLFLPYKVFFKDEQLPDFLVCGEPEVDAIGLHFSTFPETIYYIEEDVLDSFRRRVRREVETSGSIPGIRWILNLVRSLDFYYHYAVGHGVEVLKRFSLKLFDVIELEFVRIGQFGFIRHLCFDHQVVGITTAYFSSRPLFPEMELSAPLLSQKPNSAGLQSLHTPYFTPLQLTNLQPYLGVLISAGYCREDFSWIKRKDGGHSNYEAAWVAHILHATFPDIPQNQVGIMFRIPNLSTYLNRIDASKENIKAPLQRLFIERGLSISF